MSVFPLYCRCIVFIMSQTVQGMLGEKAQVNAAKELTRIINREMATMSECAKLDESSLSC